MSFSRKINNTHELLNAHAARLYVTATRYPKTGLTLRYRATSLGTIVNEVYGFYAQTIQQQLPDIAGDTQRLYPEPIFVQTTNGFKLKYKTDFINGLVANTYDLSSYWGTQTDPVTGNTLVPAKDIYLSNVSTSRWEITDIKPVTPTLYLQYPVDLDGSARLSGSNAAFRVTGNLKYATPYEAGVDSTKSIDAVTSGLFIAHRNESFWISQYANETGVHWLDIDCGSLTLASLVVLT